MSSDYDAWLAHLRDSVLREYRDSIEQTVYAAGARDLYADPTMRDKQVPRDVLDKRIATLKVLLAAMEKYPLHLRDASHIHIIDNLQRQAHDLLILRLTMGP